MALPITAERLEFASSILGTASGGLSDVSISVRGPWCHYFQNSGCFHLVHINNENILFSLVLDKTKIKSYD